MKQRTIPQLFEDSVMAFPDNVLMWEKRERHYRPTTYRELHQLVMQMAAGLLQLGLSKGDRVALISEGRNFWVISELSILYCAAISVPISVKVDEPGDLKFRLDHSGCRFAVVSGKQSPKLAAIKNDLPDLEKIILLDEQAEYDPDQIYLDEVMRLGQGLLEGGQDKLQERWTGIQEKDYATISYTSGTTADPKGIILSHRNYTANVEQSSSLMEVPPEFTSLLILPWDHSFAHTAGIYTLMKNGASMASVQSGRSALETLRNIPVNIREIRPHFLLSVPALAKNFRKNIEKGIQDQGPSVVRLFEWALKVAYAYNGDSWNRGRGWRRLYGPLNALMDRLLFSKVREGFGGRLQFFIGGGALLDTELQRFFYAIGIPMLQGYGLSEAAPVISANAMHRHKLGSSGFLVPDLELRICDEADRSLPPGEHGEIVVRGENVMLGYWRNETATRETLRDGWLYTGDLGYMDKDGFLYVLGRSKSLLIGNDGEKYSPEGIEEAITEHSPFIDQIMLYNNQSPYTVALLVPNKAALGEWLRTHNRSLNTEEGRKAALDLLQQEVDVFREGGSEAGRFPSRWLPAALAILGEGFTEKNRFMNSTLKMVRPKIIEYYQSRIDFLYTPEAKDICNSHNMNIIGRMNLGEETE